MHLRTAGVNALRKYKGKLFLTYVTWPTLMHFVFVIGLVIMVLF
jgi:hypothetical protein